MKKTYLPSCTGLFDCAPTRLWWARTKLLSGNAIDGKAVEFWPLLDLSALANRALEPCSAKRGESTGAPVLTCSQAVWRLKTPEYGEPRTRRPQARDALWADSKTGLLRDNLLTGLF